MKKQVISIAFSGLLILTGCNSTSTKSENSQAGKQQAGAANLEKSIDDNTQPHKTYKSLLTNTLVPVPNDWYIKEGESEVSKVLYITKDKINDKREFTTGYSLTFLENISKTANVSSSEYAIKFINLATEENKVIIPLTIKQINNTIQGLGVRYLTNNMIIHLYIIADDKENNLRIISFKAPESKWNQEWAYGYQMLEHSYFWIDDKSLGKEAEAATEKKDS